MKAHHRYRFLKRLLVVQAVILVVALVATAVGSAPLLPGITAAAALLGIADTVYRIVDLKDAAGRELTRRDSRTGLRPAPWDGEDR